MTVNIRLATEEDIPAVCDLVGLLSPGKTHDYRNAVEKFVKHIRDNKDYMLWVATDSISGVVVGTVMMHLQHKLSYRCGMAAHVEDLIVHPDHRGEEIGQKLIHKAIKTAVQYDCYKIMVTCWTKSIPYFQKLGFAAHDTGMRMGLTHDFYKEDFPNDAEAPYMSEDN